MFSVCLVKKKLEAAFQGMHVLPAKHSYDYQESVTTWQTDGQTDRQTPDKVLPMCHYASQATQKSTLYIQFDTLTYKDIKEGC